MSRIKTVDVVVIGAGPAGSTIASRLSQLGHRVVLIEHQAFPRHHIGETIPDSVLSLLKVIEADKPIASAGFLRTTSTLIRWTARDGTVNRDSTTNPQMQVSRSIFDQLLLDNARRLGVHIIQPAKAHAFRSENGLWHTSLKGLDTKFISPILVDASGKGGLSTNRIRYSPSTLAIYGYFGAPSDREPISHVEAISDGWMWSAPLANGQIACAVFVDGKWPRKHRGLSLESMLRQQLSRGKLFHAFCDYSLYSKVSACDASVTTAKHAMNDGIIRIGDASLSMDPLSSQGGLMAIASALQAAPLANTLLKYPEREELTEIFARTAQKSRLQQHLNTIGAYYREKHKECDTDFWRSRAGFFPKRQYPQPLNSSDALLCLSEWSKLAPAPTVKGDVISTTSALYHPKLDTPLAFVSGKKINTLLSSLKDTPSAAKLLERWALLIGENNAVDLFSKLWKAEVVVEHKKTR